MTCVHFSNRCKHGVVVAQCRCRSEDKVINIVGCPPECRGDQKLEPAALEAELMRAQKCIFELDEKLNALSAMTGANIELTAECAASVAAACRARETMTEIVRRQEERDG